MVVRKIKSSSLIETIVAMLVLVLVFLFSVMIINRVMQSASLGSMTKVKLHLHELLAETKKNKSYLSERSSWGNYTIRKEVIAKPGNDRLWVLEFIAEDEKGLILATVKEEVIAEQ
jgi:hypothetical protein